MKRFGRGAMLEFRGLSLSKPPKLRLWGFGPRQKHLRGDKCWKPFSPLIHYGIGMRLTTKKKKINNCNNND